MSHQDVMLKLDELHSKVISYVKNSNNTKKNYTECEIHLKSINYILLELENLAELSFKENINIKEKNDFLNNQIIKLQKTKEFLNIKNIELQKQNELQGEAINKHIISDDNKKNDYIKKLQEENRTLIERLELNEFILNLKTTKLQERIDLYEERFAEQEITINQFEELNTQLTDKNEILLLENDSLNNFIREQTEQMTQLNSLIESFKRVYNTTQQSSTLLSTNSNNNKSNQSYSSIPHSPPPFSNLNTTNNPPPSYFGTPSTPPP